MKNRRQKTGTQRLRAVLEADQPLLSARVPPVARALLVRLALLSEGHRRRRGVVALSVPKCMPHDSVRGHHQTPLLSPDWRGSLA